MRNRTWVPHVTAMVLLIGLVSASAFGQDAPPEPLRVVGSTTLQPVMEEVAADYHESSGVTLEISGGGSGAGLEALRAGTADVATMGPRDRSCVQAG